jgi:uncharacterized membrane protein YkvI
MKLSKPEHGKQKRYSMSIFVRRYIIPGVIIQAVMAGGGYATGRELVEFFVLKGAATGLAGMLVTTVIFSTCCMISFEISRHFKTFDYASFCKTFMGPFFILFEGGYILSLLLVLSVVCAAASEMLQTLIGSHQSINAVLYIALVSCLLFSNNKYLERIVSGWAVLFYLCYGALFISIFVRFGGGLERNLATSSINIRDALWGSITYSGYNIAIVPILIFVARNFQSRSEALIAGMLCGPLILLPGFTFLLAILNFYPEILQTRLPIFFMVNTVDIPVLSIIIKVVIFGALVKTSFGLLHGLNERISQAIAHKGDAMPRLLRPVIAIVIMTVAVYAAASFGIIDLIKNGYRYSGYYFLVIFVLPLLIRGTWMLRPSIIDSKLNTGKINESVY